MKVKRDEERRKDGRGVEARGTEKSGMGERKTEGRGMEEK